MMSSHQMERDAELIVQGLFLAGLALEEPPQHLTLALQFVETDSKLRLKHVMMDLTMGLDVTLLALEMLQGMIVLQPLIQVIVLQFAEIAIEFQEKYVMTELVIRQVVSQIVLDLNQDKFALKHFLI